jgi:hypothetical protein
MCTMCFVLYDCPNVLLLNVRKLIATPMSHLPLSAHTTLRHVSNSQRTRAGRVLQPYMPQFRDTSTDPKP